ncbi:MAG: hypothetical protein VKP70_03810 [Cyanobacteriota bacterium]|nr:hypothetical protein [Cyanobacteriota bacterium]
MSCYYPLLGLPHGIDAHLTYSSHTLNQRADPGQAVPLQHRLALALYAPGAGQWLLRDRLPVEPHGDRVVTASSYGLAPGELMVAVPVAADAFLEPRPCLLPKPVSKRVDRSPVAERCRLTFHWQGISSSYQGEYPLRMAELEGGSFLGFDPLLKPDPAVGRSLVALVTISRRLDASPLSLELMDGGSHALLARHPHQRNRCTVVEVPAEGFSAGVLVMRGSGWVAIPIVLRLSRAGLPPSMSVEHTHPPSELFWEEDRLVGHRQVKRSWLGLGLREELAP